MKDDTNLYDTSDYDENNSGIAITDDQKANLIADTLKDNFTQNTRPNNHNSTIDSDVTSTLENFFSSPPSIPISPTNPLEVSDYIKKLKIRKTPEKVSSGFQRGRSTGAVFLDIQKAFDRVWISGLIYKLIKYNFPPSIIHILNSHLVNRHYQRGGVAIYRPFGEFRRSKSYCHLYGAQGQRQVYLLPRAMMNFVGLDLTTSDSGESNSTQQQERNNSTLCRLHTIVGEKQLNSATGEKQLNSAAGAKQRNSVPSATVESAIIIYWRDLKLRYLLPS
ncbi:hypothetical protein TNCV_2929441 [Trichonephila clavipes]|nr:hypothetical protein TNCV_2929441 [Trichonephila clavipes]